MKKFFIIYIVVFSLLFSGCQYNKVHISKTSSALELDFGKDSFNTAEIKSQDDIYYYFRDKVLFSEHYKDVVIQTGSIDVKDSVGQRFNVNLIDNDYNCYHYRDSEGNVNGEIGMYNLNTKKYTKLIKLPLGSQAGLNVVNDNYLIWMESMDDSNWYKTRLHIYDKKQKKDEVFYYHSIDPETGRVYTWNWSNPVIIDDKVYFDDYTGRTEQTSKIDMFCYDIKTKEIAKVQNMAKWPTKYKNYVVWNEMGETENQCLIYAFDGKTKSLITRIRADNSMTNLNSGGDAFVFLNNDLYYNDMKNGLQIYINNKVFPIIATKNYLEWPETNGQIVVFGNVDTYQKPIFYDIKYDKIIELDLAENGFLYAKYFSDKFLMFVRRASQDDENSSYFYYLIQLSDLK